MKIKNLLIGIGLVVSGMLTSCSMEMDDFGTNSRNMIAKSPKAIVYSGETYFGNTRGTDMNANEWDKRWDCPPRPAEDLTPDEIAELKKLLSKGSEIHNTIILPFENYYVQQIYKGTDTYHSIDHCAREAYDGSGEIKCGGNNYCDHLTSGDHTNNDEILGSDHMDKLIAFDGNPYSQEWDSSINQNVSWPYTHVNNFDNGTNTNYPNECRCGEVHYKTTLMTDMPTSGIDPEKQFGFHETFGTSHNYYNYYIVEYKGYYYVGFDYEAHKYDQNTNNHGEALDVNRDWNFTDWIVRITPAYAKGTTPSENPGGVTNPDIEEKCEDCGHSMGSHSGEICGDCQASGEGPCYNASATPETPEEVTKPRNEVEVNLHGVEKNGNYLESHLSVHVRASTNVEIFIPVPKQYTCDKDDMDIVMKHEPNHQWHKGDNQYSFTHTLKDSNLSVTINISYEDDGIRIWTEGITQEVIDWCYEKCGDGITFEVWNYFNDPKYLDEEYNLSLEELQYYLNQATIKFLDELPDSYINAFNDNDDGTKNEYDCTVEIVDDQKSNYNDFYVGEHFNGSEYNEIYDKIPEPPVY